MTKLWQPPKDFSKTTHTHSVNKNFKIRIESMRGFDYKVIEN